MTPGWRQLGLAEDRGGRENLRYQCGRVGGAAFVRGVLGSFELEGGVL